MIIIIQFKKKLVGTSDESDCDEVSLTILHSDSLTSIIRFSDEGSSKGSCTMEFFDSSSSVSLTSDDGAISFFITVVHVVIVLTASHHTLSKTHN